MAIVKNGDCIFDDAEELIAITQKSFTKTAT
jgi:hypothetical protein